MNTAKINTKGSLLKKKIRALNVWIRSFGLFVWITFQIPLVLLSFIGIGLAVVSDELTYNNLTEESNDDGSVVAGAKKAAGVAKAVGTWLPNQILGMFDTNFDTLVGDGLLFESVKSSLVNIFILFYFILFFYGIMCFIGPYLGYKFAGANPVLGKSSGIKVGTVILMFIGYSIPILNLVPWFLFWTMAVQKNPE